MQTARKITGFRALYLYYCYLLGIFPKDKTRASPKRLHFLLREDLRKLDAISEETKLLIRNRIDTAEQLFSYHDEIEQKMESLVTSRKELYRLSRTAAVKADEGKTAEIKSRIAAISKELAGLRKELALCNGIAVRSGIIKEKIKTVREDENQRKENRENEHIRRRSRTNR